jgi:hypothetical protein
MHCMCLGSQVARAVITQFVCVFCFVYTHVHMQAVYSVLKEAEHRSMTPAPYWDIPLANQVIIH